ncbi:MAG: M81 family metallopeptidase [Pirellulales bacterium]
MSQAAGGWRIAIAELAQETDSFSTLLAELAEFSAYGLYRGDEIVSRIRGSGPLGGLLEVAATVNRPLTWVPLVRAWAGAGGRIRDTVFHQLRSELAAGLRDAGPLDAVFLAMHGAASSETEDDVEGAVLEEVRRIVGPEVPIVVPLDHHANITQRMIDHADLLVGHETQPHDTVATGRKAAHLMFRLLQREIAPVVCWQKIPLITPQDQFLTAAGPMKTWFDRARQWEQHPRVLDVSPYPMQPWLDVAEGGWSVVVHTDGDPELATQVTTDMASLAWKLRDEYWRSERVAVGEAVRRAGAAKQGLVILSDTGDSVYGGAPGDNTTLLAELLAQAVPGPALIPVVDPQAVEQAHQAGVAADVKLTLGGRNDCLFCQPVTVEARVTALSAGVAVEIAERGVCQLGRTALLTVGGLRIVLLEERSFAINHPMLYWHLGVDVATAQLVVVKTASNFQFFAPWRRDLIRVDTPGTTQSNLGAFDWRHLPRPIAPFDSLVGWQPTPAWGRRPEQRQPSSQERPT